MLLVHMGGRIYDPTLGRFLQADPHIQAPKSSQNYNRYSYVLNNPMSMTDPTGFFFSKLWKATTGKVLRAIASVPLLNTAINVGLNFVPGCQVWCSAAFSAATTYAVTGSLKASLTAGAITAATAYVFSEIGGHFDSLSAKAAGDGLYSFGGNFLTSGQIAQQISAHAIVGGISTSLRGGKFGHGFFSAGVTKGIGGAFLPGGSDLSDGEIAKGTVVSAVIGGTASKISGGKFANGAQTGAFQFLFNQAAPKIIDSTKEALNHYFNGNGNAVQLGPTTQDAIKNSKDQQYRLNRIKQGLSASNSGNYGVDVTSETFHVGDTPLHYSTVCNNTTCTTTFESKGDGFWDPVYSADGFGPKGEVWGGKPFRYLPFQWQETYPKP